MLYLYPLMIFIVAICAQMPVTLHHFTTYLMAVGSSLYLFSNLVIRLKRKIFLSPFFLLSVLYFLILMCSSILSPHPNVAFFVFFRVIIFFLIIGSLYVWARNYHRIFLLLKTIILIGVFLSFSLYVEFVQNGFLLFLDTGGTYRYTGIYTGANAIGLVLAFSLCVYLYFASLKIKKKLFYHTFVVSFIGIAMLLTGSRSAMLLVMMFILFFYRKHLFRVKNILLVALSVIIIFNIDSDTDIYKFLRIDRGVTNRDYLWIAGLNIFKDNPVVGIGQGVIGFELLSYIENLGIEAGSYLWEDMKDSKGNAHNFYITSLAELGLIGLTTFLLFFYFFWKRSKKLFVLSQNEFSKNFALFFQAIFFGLLCRAFFEGNALFTGGWLSIDMYFWIFIVFVFRLIEFNKNGKYIIHNI